MLGQQNKPMLHTVVEIKCEINCPALDVYLYVLQNTKVPLSQLEIRSLATFHLKLVISNFQIQMERTLKTIWAYFNLEAIKKTSSRSAAPPSKENVHPFQCRPSLQNARLCCFNLAIAPLLNVGRVGSSLIVQNISTKKRNCTSMF